MTKELIEITFGNALAQAKELETCADSMENLVRGSLSSIQSEMALSWQGENANAYFQKVNLTGTNILKTAEKLRGIAETLRRTAQIFREAEIEALDIAKRCTYHS